MAARACPRLSRGLSRLAGLKHAKEKEIEGRNESATLPPEAPISVTTLLDPLSTKTEGYCARARPPATRGATIRDDRVPFM